MRGSYEDCDLHFGPTADDPRLQRLDPASIHEDYFAWRSTAEGYVQKERC